MRISRAGWEKALSLAVLTSYLRGVHASRDEWAAQIAAGHADKAKRHLPPERVYPVAGELARRLLIDEK